MDAILALRAAQLEAGHLRETRKTYRGWLCRYMDGAAAGRFCDLQGFMTHLAVHEGLDRLNVIPFPLAGEDMRKEAAGWS